MHRAPAPGAREGLSEEERRQLGVDVEGGEPARRGSDHPLRGNSPVEFAGEEGNSPAESTDEERTQVGSTDEERTLVGSTDDEGDSSAEFADEEGNSAAEFTDEGSEKEEVDGQVRNLMEEQVKDQLEGQDNGRVGEQAQSKGDGEAEDKGKDQEEGESESQSESQRRRREVDDDVDWALVRDFKWLGPWIN